MARLSYGGVEAKASYTARLAECLHRFRFIFHTEDHGEPDKNASITIVSEDEAIRRRRWGRYLGIEVDDDLEMSEQIDL